MRTFDATVHNSIANHPEVYASLGFDPARGPVDFSELAKEPHYFALLHNEAGDGALALERSGPGLWQIHLLFAPTCRGSRAILDAIAMVREMFVEHGAQYIWGAIPLHNRPARRFARLIGGVSHGVAPHVVWGEAEEFRQDRGPWLERFG